MSIIISLGDDIKNHRILFVMEDEEHALKHAQKYCELQGIPLDTNGLQAKVKTDEGSSRWIWAWPKDVSHMYTGGKGRWVYLHAGREFTRIELHTWIPYEDVGYLMGRLRGN
jgi:hypothetical protein